MKPVRQAFLANCRAVPSALMTESITSAVSFTSLRSMFAAREVWTSRLDNKSRVLPRASVADANDVPWLGRAVGRARGVGSRVEEGWIMIGGPVSGT